MIIKNGAVFQEDGTFQVKDVYIENHRVVNSEKDVTDKKIVDAEGLLVIPGLIDIHSHGAFGHDFSDANVDGLKKILKYEKSCGITSYCPTSMTLPKERLLDIFSTVNEMEDDLECAVIRGINMEGPFLDREKKGAHVPDYLCEPDEDYFRELNESCGNKIKLVTLAPNVCGAMEFIDAMHEEVCISLGHTAADYECCLEAMRRGAHHVTHLYNAMMPFAHRDPGLIGAAADVTECMVELISDGIHVHPSVVRSTFRMFGSERVVLVSDSMMATGMEDGKYELGGQRVTVQDKKAVLDDGTIAGSATNLYDCMCKAITFGVSMADAIFAATRNPAKSIGIYDRAGSISVGKEADILLVTKDLELKQVI